MDKALEYQQNEGISPQCNDERVSLEHTQFQPFFLVFQIANPNTSLATYFDGISGGSSTRNSIDILPDLYQCFSVSFEADTLGGDPSFILRSGDSQILRTTSQ